MYVCFYEGPRGPIIWASSADQATIWAYFGYPDTPASLSSLEQDPLYPGSI